MPSASPVQTLNVLGSRIASVTYAEAVEHILARAEENLAGAYVCAANVHCVSMARWDPSYRAVLNGALLTVPDGMPLVWAHKFLGGRKLKERVYGPTLMLKLCEAAAEHGLPVYLYGGAPAIAKKLAETLQSGFPKLKIAGVCAPPFGERGDDDPTLRAEIDAINASGAKLVFVALGAPRQEIFMARHASKINAVQVGVGAAFNFHTHTVPQAPAWMQDAGLEWLYRFCAEPRRLWKRYLFYNPYFIARLALQRGGFDSVAPDPSDSPYEREPRWPILAHIGRIALLLLFAGLLIGRRDFAHLSLGDLWSAPSWAGRIYITEATLLALLPLAFLIACDRIANAPGATRLAKVLQEFGWAFIFALMLCAYGALHLFAGFARGGDTYLIVRQSALAAYPIVFVYAQIFFGAAARHVRLAAWSSVAAALLCALLDSFGWLNPRLFPETNDGMPIFGQQTLPIAILGFGFCCIATKSWPLRALAFAGLCFAAWRQSARPTQSVVYIALACAPILIAFFSTAIAWRGQRESFKRAVLLLAFFALLGAGGIALKMMRAGPERPGTETTGEMRAWSLSSYQQLFEIYTRTEMPADPAQRYNSGRPPYARVDDPEAHKLNAVFLATPSISVRNNMWRLLVWRRMFGDWQHGRWMLGSGVGKAWFYRALYSTGFHYGDEREGLDPHNSYLNTLYRYGLIGFGLLLAVLAATALHAFRSLRKRANPMLEALYLYAAYTVVFVCFTVGLEGPAYAFPFWFALGLADARACLIRAIPEAPDPHPSA